MRKGTRMIYLNNSETEQTILIPRNGCDLTGEMTLCLSSTMREDEMDWSGSVTDSGNSRNYFSFETTIDGFVPGEYDYEVKHNNKVIARGLAIVKETSQIVEYNNSITYEQYNDNE